MSTLINWSVAASGLMSLLSSVLIVKTKHLHGKLTLDTSLGVHKFHIHPTPRIGGIAIIIGCLTAHITGSLATQTEIPDPVSDAAALLGLMLLAGTPAFLFGILEDVTKKIGVRARLLATFGSGLFACLLTKTSITHVDIPGIDGLLGILPISVAFTAFAVGGVANSFNIIDGFNGLASGALIISLTAMGFIAHQAGDPTLTIVCAMVAGTILGFSAVNFPFGKIFLGDGGAYFLGFLTAWIAVLLPARNPSVSPWAPLLACGYPILEVLFSMWRKHHREGSHPGQPDKVHLHMLLYRRVSKHKFGGIRTELQNSLTSVFAWLFALVPALLATIFATNTSALMLLFLISAIMYWSVYSRLTQFSWKAVATGRFAKPILKLENKCKKAA